MIFKKKSDYLEGVKFAEEKFKEYDEATIAFCSMAMNIVAIEYHTDFIKGYLDYVLSKTQEYKDKMK